MINQVMLVGRILTIEEVENEKKKKVIIKIGVNRNLKNAEGIYETDSINIIIENLMAQNVLDYCEKGDLIGIRGRLRQGVENECLDIIADSITFLSAKEKINYKNEESEED